jgi:catechol 2,3-dioxygenase-like lactoylglutathione lyase family enzyme
VRLQHVSIPVPVGSGEEVRRFYGDLLELEERDVRPTLDPKSFIWYRAGGDLELHVMLVDEPPPERPHFCLAVEAGLDALRARLEAASVRTRDGSVLIGRPRFFCWDPFGNLVEFTQLSR